ncbi:thioredoxin family protein [Chloroflexia bacterium SDU3-3]|nr:thioredoxin family protein [Chloroflexia bacterium SDU3-3]
MIERIALLVGLALAVGAGWAALRAWQAHNLRRLGNVSPLAQIVPAGRPAVVAFSTPSCADCRTRQKPALDLLQRAVGEQVAVVALSALEHPELVDTLGILTVPATVVLGSDGSVRHLNQGYASAATLGQQALGRAVLA